MIKQNTDPTQDLSAAFIDDIDQIIGLSNLKQGDAVANLDYGVTAANLGATAVAFPSSTQDVAALIKAPLHMAYRLCRKADELGWSAGAFPSPVRSSCPQPV
jgi:hypothetical protein